MGGWGMSVGVKVKLVDVRGSGATGAAGGHR